MTLAGLSITKHAWWRFRQRCEGGATEAHLEHLLQQASETDLGPGNVIRTISNGCKPARYFETKEWRFVTDEDRTTLITCERPYFETKGRRKKGRKQKSRG